MEDRKSELADFFDRYAALFNEALAGKTDVEATAGSFADCFIEASPAGITCARNDGQFRQVIPQGYDFYRQIGISSMKIVSKDISILDAFHSLVRIKWRSGFTRKDGSKGSLGFEVIYFIRSAKDGHRIFGYITGDEQSALREEGLI